MVTSILLLACFYTRRRYSNDSNSSAPYKSLLDHIHPSHELSLLPLHPHTRPSSEGLLTSEDRDDLNVLSTLKNPPKKRYFCGTLIRTPNSSQFAGNYHSRTLRKFPFLVEIFYWIITFIIYRITHILSQEMFSEGIWDTAQANGLSVLAAEQFTPLRFLLPAQEIEVQAWFMDGHQGLLTFLNRFYALIHIPGTVL